MNVNNGHFPSMEELLGPTAVIFCWLEISRLGVRCDQGVFPQALVDLVFSFLHMDYDSGKLT